MILDFIEYPSPRHSWTFTSEELETLRDYITSFDKVILYHGTSDVFKEKILAEGLKCRALTGNSVWERTVNDTRPKGIESRADRVYVGRSNWSSRMGYEAIRKFGGKEILFQLLLSRDMLIADEDSGKQTGDESLTDFGCAAVQGIIPPDHIIGVYDPSTFYRKSFRTPIPPCPILNEKISVLTTASFRRHLYGPERFGFRDYIRGAVDWMSGR